MVLRCWVFMKESAWLVCGYQLRDVWILALLSWLSLSVCEERASSGLQPHHEGATLVMQSNANCSPESFFSDTPVEEMGAQAFISTAYKIFTPYTVNGASLRNGSLGDLHCVSFVDIFPWTQMAPTPLGNLLEPWCYMQSVAYQGTIIWWLIILPISVLKKVGIFSMVPKIYFYTLCPSLPIPLP